MPCEPMCTDVFQCSFCDTQFERDIADAGPDGEPRCPQCGLLRARRIAPEEYGPFIVTGATKFR